MAAGQQAPAFEGDRAGELGQHPGGELRGAARQQQGRVPVAALGPQPQQQALGEGGPAAVAQQPGEVGADHGGGVVVRGFDDPVGDGRSAGAAQGVAADDRVGVGQARGQVVGVRPGQGGERAEPPFVRAEPVECGEQRPELAAGGQRVRGEGGVPQAGLVREGVECGEQLFDGGDHRDGLSQTPARDSYRISVRARTGVRRIRVSRGRGEGEGRGRPAQFGLLRAGRGPPSGADQQRVLVGERRGKAAPAIFSSSSRDRARPSAGGSAASGRCAIRSRWCRVHSRTYAAR